MAAYKTYNGTNEAPVFSAASQLLTKDKIGAFLSLPESFSPGGLDDALVRCAVIGGGGASPALLAEYASQGSTEEMLVSRLLNDTMLMRDMLVAGGAKGGKYGEAMGILDKLLKASTYLNSEERVNANTPWDDRSQKNILHRLALGTAVEVCVAYNIALALSHNDAHHDMHPPSSAPSSAPSSSAPSSAPPAHVAPGRAVHQGR
jgi:hypothetical protein